MSPEDHRNFIGVPKESYGASNNPKKRLRSPPFDEAKFSLNAAEQAIEIKLMIIVSLATTQE